MRAASAIGAAIALTLLAAAPARAAPTCVDREGGVIRCGTPGAMPVGWAPPEASDTPADDMPGPGLGQLAGLVAVIGGLFALIALMPEFEGWDDRERDDD